MKLYKCNSVYVAETAWHASYIELYFPYKGHAYNSSYNIYGIKTMNKRLGLLLKEALCINKMC